MALTGTFKKLATPPRLPPKTQGDGRVQTRGAADPLNQANSPTLDARYSIQPVANPARGDVRRFRTRIA